MWRSDTKYTELESNNLKCYMLFYKIIYANILLLMSKFVFLHLEFIKIIIIDYMDKQSILKRVIIRLDISGISDIKDWISKSERYIQEEYFEQFKNGFRNNFQVDITNPEDIAQSLSIPVSAIEKEPIYIYTKFRKNSASIIAKLEITRFYILFDIQCSKEYKTVQPYIDCILDLYKSLSETHKFAQIERVGIRKINGLETEEFKKGFDVFVPTIYATDCDSIKEMKIYKKDYFDFLYNPEQGFKCNFKRGIKFNEKTKKYQFILDIDGYVDKIGIDRLLVKSSEELREIMCSLINKNIYSIFENSITPEFKAEISHE